MKKAFVKGLLCLLILAMTVHSSAWAGGQVSKPVNPINPYYDEAQPPSRNGIQRASSAMTISIECLAVPSYETDAQWQVFVSGAVGDCTYTFYLLDANWDTCGYSGEQTEPVYNYRFVVPGDYILYVMVCDAAGNTEIRTQNFTLECDSAHPTLESVVTSIVNECLSAGCATDFEKAVWLHDWLTANASYDLSYSYYSADGVLVRGTGVCDSYRKAYEMLLNEAGVEATSATGGNHAWNQIKMNGEWYNVDVTWDDPVSSTGEQQAAVSGMERHFYFGLTDEVMRVDHTFENHPKQCTSYEMNYFLHTGKVRMWSDAYSDGISIALENCEFLVDLTIPDYYIIENGYYSYGNEHIVYDLVVNDLLRQKWSVGDKELSIHTYYEQGANSLPVEVLLDPYTLALPTDSISVEEEAFRGDTGFMAVIIPDETSLGDYCFAECADLWKVVIPDSVTSISPSAFFNCDSVAIVCSEGSYAYQYAQSNGLRVLIR